MRVLGFNYEKVSIEKMKELQENFKINTNMDVSDIKEIKSGIINTKDTILQVKFVYNVKYEPDFAVVDLKGNMLLSIEESLAKEVLKDWKKKNMPSGFRVTLFNMIMRKASIKAVELEDDLNLPPHLPLPVLRMDQKEK